jgi:hypothetical protein
MSLAEYCGLWPAAGGQQFYVTQLATEKHKRWLSYMVGCTLLAAQLATSASCAVNSAEIVLRVMRGQDHEKYANVSEPTPQRGLQHTRLIGALLTSM